MKRCKAYVVMFLKKKKAVFKGPFQSRMARISSKRTHENFSRGGPAYKYNLKKLPK